MKFTNTKAFSTRLLMTLALAAVSVIGLSGFAEAANCTTCHAISASDIRPVEHATVFRNITTGAIKGSHAKHIPSVTMVVSACTPCHGGAGSYTTSHRSGYINVTSALGTPSLTYSRTSKFPQSGDMTTKVFGVCSTTYCHSSGQATPAYVGSPAWGVTANLTCEGCHGFNAAATNKVVTNKHAAHVNNSTFLGSNYTCGECHSNTVAAGTDSPITVSANHINTIRNYSGAKAYKTGYPVSLGTCTTYCHSSGKKGLAIASVTLEPTNPSWNAVAQPLDCKGCHGLATGGLSTTASIAGDPNYPNVAANVPGSNSHNKHVGTAAATSCEACHTNTIDATGALKTGTNHTNKTVDVNFNTTKAGASVTWTANNKTCANISCHSGSSAVWGATLTCESCHGFNAAATNKIVTNKHAVHVNNATFLGSNYTCGACHANVVAQATDSPVTVSANHANSLANYSGATAYKSGYTVGSLTNCTTYCHSSGKKGLAIATVTLEPSNPSWNAVAQPLDCKGCHGLATGGASTASSTAGDPNYPNVAANVAGSNSHNKHVGTAAATSCEACHTNTIDALGVLKTGANHTNKIVDVNFNTTKAGASVTWTAGTKTCANISCHSGSGIVAGVASVQWGATLTCLGCHGDVTTIATGSHTAHRALSGVTCASCHNATATTNTALVVGTRHLDSGITVNFNTAAAPVGGTYNGTTAGGASVYSSPTAATGTCATSNCHGSTNPSPAWGTNLTAYNTCTKCHGTSTLSTTVISNANNNRWLVAPPTTGGANGSTTGVGQVSNNVRVGAHQTHLQTFNGFSNYSTVDFNCAGCHGNSVTSYTTSHATGNASTPTFPDSNLSNSRGLRTVTYNTTNRTCSNTYCHNPATGTTGNTINALNVGTGIFPSWTSAKYLGDTRKTQANCNKCHKSPGDVAAAITVTSTTSHAGFTILTSCAQCHEHEGDTAGSVGRRHMDGKLWGGGDCNSCHDYDSVGSVWTGATTNRYTTTGTWGKNDIAANGGLGYGAHAQHINYIKARLSLSTQMTASSQTYGVGDNKYVCGTCHTVLPGKHNTAGEMGRSINFNDAGNMMAPSHATLAKTLLYALGTNPAYEAVGRTCSNLSCHYFTSPAWSN